MNKTNSIMSLTILGALWLTTSAHAQTPEDLAELTTLRDAYNAKRDAVIQQNVEAVKSLSVAVDATTVARHEAELAALKEQGAVELAAIKAKDAANRAAAQAALAALDDPALTLTLSRLRAILGPMLTAKEKPDELTLLREELAAANKRIAELEDFMRSHQLPNIAQAPRVFDSPSFKQALLDGTAESLNHDFELKLISFEIR